MIFTDHLIEVLFCHIPASKMESLGGIIDDAFCHPKTQRQFFQKMICGIFFV